jgi:hypothetical protein
MHTLAFRISTKLTGNTASHTSEDQQDDWYDEYIGNRLRNNTKGCPSLEIGSTFTNIAIANLESVLYPFTAEFSFY